MNENAKGKIEKTGTFCRGFQRGGTHLTTSFQNHKSKIEELEDATFNCGHRDNAVRFESAVENITSYMVCTYRGGVHVGTTIQTGAIPNLLKTGIGVKKLRLMSPAKNGTDTKPVR